MFSPQMYQLLDFGGGRKLERFGNRVLDRPSPAADGSKRACDAPTWAQADARFERAGGQGQWFPASEASASWPLTHGDVTFELQQTPFGHVGLFVEQAANWDWIRQVVSHADRPLVVLNLFAYTGASTLAAASLGAEVVHVDAAKTTVGWARRNAQLSTLADAPIRWITEDAVRFVQRELKRGNRYDAVIMDPPSYGNGPSRGQRWRASEHLPELVAMCGELMCEDPAFFLLTCHTSEYESPRLARLLADALRVQSTVMDHGAMAIKSADGRHLNSGVFARWEAQ